MKQDDSYNIFVGQEDAAKCIEYIEIPPGRRKQLSATASAAEISELRRVIGAVGWVARQTRADLLARTSLLAQQLSLPTVSSLVETNKLVKLAISGAHLGLVFRADIGLDFNSMSIVCVADAAHANVIFDGEKVKSQAGYMLGLKAKDRTGVQLVEFSTGTIRRVCRSSLACEANAMITAMESAD